jgi:hypothetical protein
MLSCHVSFLTYAGAVFGGLDSCNCVPRNKSFGGSPPLAAEQATTSDSKPAGKVFIADLLVGPTGNPGRVGFGRRRDPQPPL